MLGRKAQFKDSQTLIKIKMEIEGLAEILDEGREEYIEYKEERAEDVDAVVEELETQEGIIETEKDRERAYIVGDAVRKERIVYKILRIVGMSKGLHTKTMKDFTTRLSSTYTKKNYTDLMHHLGSNIPMMSGVQIVELAEFISSEDSEEEVDAAYSEAVSKSQKSV